MPPKTDVDKSLVKLLLRASAVEVRLDEVAGRLSVVETNSIDYENRLEDLEEKQDAKEDSKACP
jgi:hypothetical protein